MRYWQSQEPETCQDLVILAAQRFLPTGGEAAWHYWSGQSGAMGGWRFNRAEAQAVTYRDCLAILDRLVPKGRFLITPLERPTLRPGATAQASEGPATSACAGSFCEIADRHDKGGVAA